MSHSPAGERQSLAIAVLTVSDTRNEETDTSGQYLVESLQQEGHRLIDKQIVIDDIYLIRSVLSQWIANPEVHAVLITGGTGFTGRDSTPEAVSVLFDKTIEGFGELFRYLSYDEIGTSTVQSRALAGLANETVIFCMPGSTGACQTAWGKIIREQLDSSYSPCNFVGVLKTRAQQKGRA
jgi:molybdenum cofactor biosynthesis protein B